METEGIAICQKCKPNGEDRAVYQVSDNGALYIGVFDGHGGSGAASWCVNNMDLYIEAELRKGYSMVAALRNAFIRAHNSIADGSGTTASVVLVRKRYVAVAHVGDSRVVLCRGGKAVTITEDHHLDWEAERVRISEYERRHNTALIMGRRVDGLMVTRSIGDKRLSNAIVPCPVVNEFLLTGEDKFLIVATDGLWDVVDGPMAMRLLEEQKLTKAGDIADALVYTAGQQYSSRRKRADDITCCVLDLRSV